MRLLDLVEVPAHFKELTPFTLFYCSGLLDGALYANGCVTARGLKLTQLRADVLNVIQERAHTLDVSENMCDTCCY